MNRLAFVFTHGPHGNATSREGLDALLAISALVNDIHVFFITDGVLLLVAQQQPEVILARNFVATFGVLPLYDITNCYICADSVLQHGLSSETNWILATQQLSSQNWRQNLETFNVILTF